MNFVKEHSIVRRIWGNTDVILFIFAGAAAEFALNKAVDWLYFTGKLPKDPLGRLFSTVTYAQKIVFASMENAHAAIDQITMIHKHVEAARDAKIPDWAYRDVLFMLIYYSISAFELLERKLSITEKEELFDTFNRVGLRMGIPGLPNTFEEWEIAHAQQLREDLSYSKLSKNLYKQYRKHLGAGRYHLMRQIQAQIVPQRVNDLLLLGHGKMVTPILACYKMTRKINAHTAIRNLILPRKYKAEILGLASPAV